MVKHVNIKVYGKVQGVFYRAFVRDTCQRNGLKGFVRNETDGTVYIEAEGEPEKLNALIGQCYKGPPRARVEKVITEEGNIAYYKDFSIN